MTETLVTPDTRIGELIREHPEILEFLIGFSPRFAALRNPVMRRTIGRVATVAQAASIADVPAPALVMALRKELGQRGGEAAGDEGDTSPAFRPGWAGTVDPAIVFDGDELIAQGQAPVNVVRQRLAELNPGDVILLRVSFKPEPLIQALERHGARLFAAPAPGDGWEVWIRNA